MPRRTKSYFRYRRKRTPLHIAFTLLVLVLVIIADRQGWLIALKPEDYQRYHNQQFSVTYVFDGDTFEIEAEDLLEAKPTTRVRFWGINCPEVANAYKPTAQQWSAEAKEFTEQKVAAGPVTLHLETNRLRGKYKRILAHVELADGTNLNEALLEAGLARADERWPHGNLSRYAQAERRAKEARRGIWSDQ